MFVHRHDSIIVYSKFKVQSCTPFEIAFKFPLTIAYYRCLSIHLEITSSFAPTDLSSALEATTSATRCCLSARSKSTARLVRRSKGGKIIQKREEHFGCHVLWSRGFFRIFMDLLKGGSQNYCEDIVHERVYSHSPQGQSVCKTNY